MSEPALILSTLSASRPKQACNMRDHPAQTLETLSQIFLHSHLLWWRSRTVLTITQTNRKYLRRARALSQHLHTFVHLVLVQLESSNAASQGCSTPSTEAANQTECQWHSRWITAATRWQFIYIFNFILTMARSNTRRKMRQGSLWLLSWLIYFDSCALTSGISRCSCK